MISVFDAFTPQNGFTTCGERILNPTVCKIHQEENGDYSLELHQPILSSDDSYQFLRPNNIIKPNSGQLFVIYYVQRKMVNLVPTVIVKARHIFYYLNDKVTYDIQTHGANGWSCYTVLDQLFEHAYWGKGTGLIDYDFTHTSDISDWRHYTANGVSVGRCIFELCNTWSGFLYRDNFDIKINRTMYGRKLNAFSAIHGWNVSDITETIDYTDKITELHTKDNFGNTHAISYTPVGAFPHQVDVYIEFSYQEQSNLVKDTEAYLGVYKNPATSYDINLVDLSDTSRAAGWDGFERVKVGDEGTVYSSLLGINTDQRVVSIDYDDITGRNTNVKIAGFEKSSLHPGRFADSICGNNAETKRIANLEKKSSYFQKISI